MKGRRLRALHSAYFDVTLNIGQIYDDTRDYRENRSVLQNFEHTPHFNR